MDSSKSTEILCGVCYAQHLTKKADYWCSECDEGLCSECLTHHSASKYTRTHAVISIKSYKLLPPSITNIIQHCPEHDRKYQHYCPHHECLCCPICLTTRHNKCVDLLAIEEMVKNAKSSTLFLSMEQSLNDLKNYIEKIVEDRKLNLLRITEQHRVFQDQIKEMRQKINSHLDTIERQMLTDLNLASDRIKSQIENLLTQITEKTQTINIMQNTISAVKMHASDIQTYLFTKYLQNPVEIEKKYIENLSEDKRLCQIDIKCRFDDTMRNLESILSVFGSIVIETGASFIMLSRESERKEQLKPTTQAIASQSIHNIKLQLTRKLEIPHGKGNRLTGCTVSPAGKVIIADFNFNKRIIILNQTDGKIEKEIPLSSNPVDVTYIDDTMIAVTATDPNEIQIVNIDTYSVEKVIPLSNSCYGITYRSGKLFYCEVGRGMQSLDNTANTITTIVQQKNMTEWNSVASSEDRLYKTDYKTNTVTCYSMSGETVWEFRDETILKSPLGIALDKQCNVYVASKGTYGIVVISYDGQCGRKLGGHNYGLDELRGVCLSKDGKILVVITLKGTVCLYSVL